MNITCNGTLIDLSSPKIMGILNVTPNSFYDGGAFENIDEVLKQTEKMLSDGATFIDVGGASSKPGVAEVSLEEELKRVIPVIEKIAEKFPDAFISIDTYRSAVAAEAVAAGAHIVNDISAGNLDNKMIRSVGALGVPYIAMHMQGTPQTMQQNPNYENVLVQVRHFFSEKIAEAYTAGISDIILDPGFGFGKTLEHNFTLLNNLDSLRIEGIPLLAGVSRKSMITKTLEIDTESALNGTTVLNTIAIQKGANILRVHDVYEARQVLQLSEALQFDMQ